MHFKVVDGQAVPGVGGDDGQVGSFWIVLQVHSVG